MSDQPDADTPKLGYAKAAAVGSVTTRRLEAEMAPLLARLDALEARVAGLENARKTGYAPWLSLPHRTHGRGGRKR